MEKIIGIETVTSITTKSPYIDSMGNISYKEGIEKYCISIGQNGRENVKGNRLSKEYYYMSELFDDHYAVCDVYSNQSLEQFDDSRLSFKFGVIALQRDSVGNIIPMGEKVVVPIVYDDMYGSSLGTIIGLVNDHSTYIDINPNSENYGEQLVPAVLDDAYPFSAKYHGFAECSVDGVRGYLPRDCEPRTSLSPSQLLTEEQVQNTLLYSEIDSDYSYRGSLKK